ncbi:PhzF family phenazine biosynthesis protein [Bifidobacterium psychraerophilum]|uniref:PhzF family phenazine biosynthesis protein n=1 Tax=Bifidobacterium psychraerophilum TaxID=218140 RepID=UPI0033413E0C
MFIAHKRILPSRKAIKTPANGYTMTSIETTHRKAAPMPRTRPFAQVDVFSPEAYGGNPLAVIVDAEGMSEQDMQRITRWTNLSETTFILPPTSNEADYRLRIFTPGGELPFAGHPTLGSAHAWLEHGGTPHDPERIIQECLAGMIPIRPDDNGTLSFAAPPTTRTGPLEHEFLERIVDAFGIDPSQVSAHQWVDNGPGWAVLRLATAQEVLDLDPDLSRIPDAMVGAIGAYPPGSPAAFEMRTFAPRVGVKEDPVCGSMNASVGQWLARTGETTHPYTISQGTTLGRTGRITITPDTNGTIWIGGNTTTLFNGTALA